MKILKLMFGVTITIFLCNIYAYGQQDHYSAYVYNITSDETIFEIRSDSSRYMNGRHYSFKGTDFKYDTEYVLDMFDGENANPNDDVIYNVREVGERWH